MNTPMIRVRKRVRVEVGVRDAASRDWSDRFRDKVDPRVFSTTIRSRNHTGHTSEIARTIHSANRVRSRV